MPGTISISRLAVVNAASASVIGFVAIALRLGELLIAMGRKLVEWASKP